MDDVTNAVVAEEARLRVDWEGPAEVPKCVIQIRAVTRRRALFATSLARSKEEQAFVFRYPSFLAFPRNRKPKPWPHYLKDASLTDLFKLLKERHPKLQNLGPRASDIQQIIRSLSAVIGVLNPLRNKASVAHPNPQLLDEPEAMLVINAARTILHYLDTKLS